MKLSSRQFLNKIIIKIPRRKIFVNKGKIFLKFSWLFVNNESYEKEKVYILYL